MINRVLQVDILTSVIFANGREFELRARKLLFDQRPLKNEANYFGIRRSIGSSKCRSNRTTRYFLRPLRGRHDCCHPQSRRVRNRCSIMSSRRFSAAAWSRYASRTYPISSEGNEEQFLGQLLRIGAAEPGHVLLPTSDHTAWLYTKTQICSPNISPNQPFAIHFTSDTRQETPCGSSCQRRTVGLPSWCPQNINELVTIALRLVTPY